MSGEDCMLVCRSDSSAARSLAGRLGIGRACHIEANLLWLQQKVAEKSLTITPIPSRHRDQVHAQGEAEWIEVYDQDG